MDQYKVVSAAIISHHLNTLFEAFGFIKDAAFTKANEHVVKHMRREGEIVCQLQLLFEVGL
ncbi:hypothetical protein [Vibrio sp. SCSIO 43136]|uniref:hypothetical protein n=1 Tax=Vibrio sp. SCSIO 43136 TaxID=2819101 RepID=UPI00218487E1|nr:hypothetical protein J4N39_15160 [Vibrio sp. SCSIO 43136]